MAYTSNIPQPGDNPSQSQGQILDNFIQIATAFNLNHGLFNDAAEGKHRFMQMPEQSSAPTTGANEGALYTADSGTQPDLFYRNESNGSSQQITNTSPSLVGSNYAWTFSDGLALRFGTVAHSGTSTTVTFSTAFATAAYIVLITPIGSAALISGYNAQGLGLSSFFLRSVGSGAGQNFYYLAIGR